MPHQCIIVSVHWLSTHEFLATWLALAGPVYLAGASILAYFKKSLFPASTEQSASIADVFSPAFLGRFALFLSLVLASLLIVRCDCKART